MKSIDFEALSEFFNCDVEDVAGAESFSMRPGAVASDDKFRELIDYESMASGKHAVLGIDIYKYSSYDFSRQIAIPFVFQQLLIRTFKVCLATEPFLFQKYAGNNFDKCLDRFLDKFIDTGDGGFIIFDTPLHAIIFALYFEAIVRNFNSRFIYGELSAFTDMVLLRYAVSYDTVYLLKNRKIKKFNNYYGPGIINCQRIISRDKLNRCLIDNETYKWFMFNARGIETLSYMPFGELKKSVAFEGYDFWSGAPGKASFCLPDRRCMDRQGIHRVDVLKIGEINSKNTVLSIYNLHMQFSYQLPSVTPGGGAPDINYFTVTLGNLNTGDIA